MKTKQSQKTPLAIGLGLTVFTAGILASHPAEAATLFKAALTGSQEVPANGSSAFGFGTVLLNDTEDQISVNLSFSNLSAPATVAHIHGPAAPGVNAPVLFGLSGVPNTISGVIPEQTFSISAAQVDFLKQGLLYFNVHNTTFPGGEIRGQILATPEPSSMLGFLALGTLGAVSAFKHQLKAFKSTQKDQENCGV
jgi:hypothetical protein